MFLDFYVAALCNLGFTIRGLYLKQVWPPLLYSFSVGKCMHSYHHKVLPNHFDEYFIQLSSIHYHSTRLATPNNLILPRVNSSSGKCPLLLIAQRYGLQYHTILNFQQPLPLNGNLKNTSYMKQIPNYEY